MHGQSHANSANFIDNFVSSDILFLADDDTYILDQYLRYPGALPRSLSKSPTRQLRRKLADDGQSARSNQSVSQLLSSNRYPKSSPLYTEEAIEEAHLTTAGPLLQKRGSQDKMDVLDKIGEYYLKFNPYGRPEEEISSPIFPGQDSGFEKSSTFITPVKNIKESGEVKDKPRGDAFLTDSASLNQPPRGRMHSSGFHRSGARYSKPEFINPDSTIGSLNQMSMTKPLLEADLKSTITNKSFPLQESVTPVVEQSILKVSVSPNDQRTPVQYSQPVQQKEEIEEFEFVQESPDTKPMMSDRQPIDPLDNIVMFSDEWKGEQRTHTPEKLQESLAYKLSVIAESNFHPKADTIPELQPRPSPIKIEHLGPISNAGVTISDQFRPGLIKSNREAVEFENMFNLAESSGFLESTIVKGMNSSMRLETHEFIKSEEQFKLPVNHQPELETKKSLTIERYNPMDEESKRLGPLENIVRTDGDQKELNQLPKLENLNRMNTFPNSDQVPRERKRSLKRSAFTPYESQIGDDRGFSPPPIAEDRNFNFENVTEKPGDRVNVESEFSKAEFSAPPQKTDAKPLNEFNEEQPHFIEIPDENQKIEENKSAPEEAIHQSEKQAFENPDQEGLYEEGTESNKKTEEEHYPPVIHPEDLYAMNWAGNEIQVNDQNPEQEITEEVKKLETPRNYEEGLIKSRSHSDIGIQQRSSNRGVVSPVFPLPRDSVTDLWSNNKVWEIESKHKSEEEEEEIPKDDKKELETAANLEGPSMKIEDRPLEKLEEAKVEAEAEEIKQVTENTEIGNAHLPGPLIEAKDQVLEKVEETKAESEITEFQKPAQEKELESADLAGPSNGTKEEPLRKGEEVNDETKTEEDEKIVEKKEIESAADLGGPSIETKDQPIEQTEERKIEIGAQEIQKPLEKDEFESANLAGPLIGPKDEPLKKCEEMAVENKVEETIKIEPKKGLESSGLPGPSIGTEGRVSEEIKEIKDEIEFQETADKRIKEPPTGSEEHLKDIKDHQQPQTESNLQPSLLEAKEQPSEKSEEKKSESFVKTIETVHELPDTDIKGSNRQDSHPEIKDIPHEEKSEENKNESAVKIIERNEELKNEIAEIVTEKVEEALRKLEEVQRKFEEAQRNFLETVEQNKKETASSNIPIASPEIKVQPLERIEEMDRIDFMKEPIKTEERQRIFERGDSLTYQKDSFYETGPFLSRFDAANSIKREEERIYVSSSKQRSEEDLRVRKPVEEAEERLPIRFTETETINEIQRSHLFYSNYESRSGRPSSAQNQPQFYDSANLKTSENLEKPPLSEFKPKEFPKVPGFFVESADVLGMQVLTREHAAQEKLPEPRERKVPMKKISKKNKTSYLLPQSKPRRQPKARGQMNRFGIPKDVGVTTAEELLEIDEFEETLLDDNDEMERHGDELGGTVDEATICCYNNYTAISKNNRIPNKPHTGLRVDPVVMKFHPAPQTEGVKKEKPAAASALLPHQEYVTFFEEKEYKSESKNKKEKSDSVEERLPEKKEDTSIHEEEKVQVKTLADLQKTQPMIASSKPKTVISSEPIVLDIALGSELQRQSDQAESLENAEENVRDSRELPRVDDIKQDTLQSKTKIDQERREREEEEEKQSNIKNDEKLIPQSVEKEASVISEKLEEKPSSKQSIELNKTKEVIHVISLSGLANEEAMSINSIEEAKEKTAKKIEEPSESKTKEAVSRAQSGIQTTLLDQLLRNAKNKNQFSNDTESKVLFPSPQVTVSEKSDKVPTTSLNKLPSFEQLNDSLLENEHLKPNNLIEFPSSIILDDRFLQNVPHTSFDDEFAKNSNQNSQTIKYEPRISYKELLEDFNPQLDTDYILRGFVRAQTPIYTNKGARKLGYHPEKKEKAPFVYDNTLRAYEPDVEIPAINPIYLKNSQGFSNLIHDYVRMSEQPLIREGNLPKTPEKDGKGERKLSPQTDLEKACNIREQHLRKALGQPPSSERKRRDKPGKSESPPRITNPWQPNWYGVRKSSLDSLRDQEDAAIEMLNQSSNYDSSAARGNRSEMYDRTLPANPIQQLQNKVDTMKEYYYYLLRKDHIQNKLSSPHMSVRDESFGQIPQHIGKLVKTVKHDDSSNNYRYPKHQNVYEGDTTSPQQRRSRNITPNWSPQDTKHAIDRFPSNIIREVSKTQETEPRSEGGNRGTEQLSREELKRSMGSKPPHTPSPFRDKKTLSQERSTAKRGTNLRPTNDKTAEKVKKRSPTRNMLLQSLLTDKKPEQQADQRRSSQNLAPQNSLDLRSGDGEDYHPETSQVEETSISNYKVPTRYMDKVLGTRTETLQSEDSAHDISSYPTKPKDGRERGSTDLMELLKPVKSSKPKPSVAKSTNSITGKAPLNRLANAPSQTQLSKPASMKASRSSVDLSQPKIDLIKGGKVSEIVFKMPGNLQEQIRVDAQIVKTANTHELQLSESFPVKRDPSNPARKELLARKDFDKYMNVNKKPFLIVKYKP